jgi:hypothetical protein
MPFDFKHKLLSFCFQKSVVQIKYIEFVEEESTYSGVISYFIYLLKNQLTLLNNKQLQIKNYILANDPRERPKKLINLIFKLKLKF